MVKTTTLKRPRQVIRQRKEIMSNWLSNTLLSLPEFVHSSFAQLLSTVSKLIHLAPRLKPLPRFICLCRLECYLIKVNAVWPRSAVFTFTAQRVRVAPSGTGWLFWSSLQHLTTPKLLHWLEQSHKTPTILHYAAWLITSTTQDCFHPAVLWIYEDVSNYLTYLITTQHHNIYCGPHIQFPLW